MGRLLKIFAIVLGSGWFVPVSCTSGVFVGTHVIAKLDERQVQKGDVIHSLFKVAAVPGEQGSPFRVLGTHEITPYLATGAAQPANGPVTFRMPAQSGSMHSKELESTLSYRVLEDTGREQFIELVETYDDGDNTIWSRYRATSTSVSPVGSRMFYFGYMFGAVPYAFVGALVLYGVGRRLRKRFSGTTVGKENS